MTLTPVAPQVLGRPLLQSQLEFYRLYHQRGRREPRMHLLALLHHLNEQDAEVLGGLASPEKSNPTNIS